MKRRSELLLWLVLAVGVLFYLAGCSLTGVSVDDRVMQFLADLNDIDRSQVYLNFHPDILDYGGIQVAGFWDAYFPYANAPYFISSLATGDSSNVTFTLTDSGIGSWAVKFVMRQLGNDWMISEMYMDVSPGPAVTLIVN